MHKSKIGRFFMLILVMLLVGATLSIVVLSQDDEETEPPHWTYEGEDGPEFWGELSEDYATCADGTAQSPINVSGAIGVDLVNIAFDYAGSAMNIFNNGHTIQVNIDAGSSITVNEITYDLLQFHFHHPSEHTIDGVAADMEIHFVHRDPNSGNLAVVGVMLMAGEGDNASYAPIFDNLPAEESEPEAMDIMLDLVSLLPEQQTYFTYQGSLTTPPCSEIVRWLLLDTPVELSEAQIEAFGVIFEANARPIQSLNTRDLFVDITE